MWAPSYNEQKVAKCCDFSGGDVMKLFKYKLSYSNVTYVQKSEETIPVDLSELTQSKHTQETSQIKK